MFVRSFFLATALVAAVPATAATIADLYNTGVTNGGVATTGSGADLHWALAGGTAYTGGTNGSFPIGPWVSDDAGSRWITPTTDAADTLPNGNYTFSTTFDLTGYSLNGASISGDFAADDSATIFLNGVQIGSGGGFSFITGFGATTGFVAGVNMLTFVVLNSGGGPTGLNVDVSGVAFVPEPATWGLMIAGFGMVGYAARRRRAAVTA